MAQPGSRRRFVSTWLVEFWCAIALGPAWAFYVIWPFEADGADGLIALVFTLLFLTPLVLFKSGFFLTAALASAYLRPLYAWAYPPVSGLLLICHYWLLNGRRGDGDLSGGIAVFTIACMGNFYLSRAQKEKPASTKPAGLGCL